MIAQRRPGNSRKFLYVAPGVPSRERCRGECGIFGWCPIVQRMASAARKYTKNRCENEEYPGSIARMHCRAATTIAHTL
jgi:hypothetical protein